MTDINPDYLDFKIKEAFTEDLAGGDVTTDALFSEPFSASAIVLSREAGVIAGGEIVRRVFHYLDKNIDVDIIISDGGECKDGNQVIRLNGDCRSILRGERIALNFLGHLSGIASLTQAFVRQVKGTRAKILDTRKTHPGMRPLEKYAVKMGGGENHRMGLFDRYLIKDNHLISLGDTGKAIDRCHEHRKKHNPELLIEVEVEDLEGVRTALEHKADIILLDNMPADRMKKAVDIINGKAKVEASGGINLENAADAARTGVDYISVGSLTHSVRSLDFSMEFEPL